MDKKIDELTAQMEQAAQQKNYREAADL
jgi:tryptophanyl-tRNA synthetase